MQISLHKLYTSDWLPLKIIKFNIKKPFSRDYLILVFMNQCVPSKNASITLSNGFFGWFFVLNLLLNVVLTLASLC